MASPHHILSRALSQARAITDFAIASHPCFWSFPHGASTSFGSLHALRDKCRCPATAHSFKDAYDGQGRLMRSKRSLQMVCESVGAVAVKPWPIA